MILKLDHDHDEGLRSKLDFETLQFSNAIVLNVGSIWSNPPCTVRALAARIPNPILQHHPWHCESASYKIASTHPPWDYHPLSTVRVLIHTHPPCNPIPLALWERHSFTETGGPGRTLNHSFAEKSMHAYMKSTDPTWNPWWSQLLSRCRISGTDRLLRLQLGLGLQHCESSIELRGCHSTVGVLGQQQHCESALPAQDQRPNLSDIHEVLNFYNPRKCNIYDSCWFIMEGCYSSWFMNASPKSSWANQPSWGKAGRKRSCRSLKEAAMTLWECKPTVRIYAHCESVNPLWEWARLMLQGNKMFWVV